MIDHFFDSAWISSAMAKSAIEYLYFGLLLGAYGSFWYSSLKVFNKNTSLNKFHRYAFKFLVTATWYFSAYAFFAAESLHWAALGCAVVAVAIWQFWISVQHIRHTNFAVIFDSQTPTSYVTSGPYRWVRHPFYSSYVLVYFSLVFVIPSIFLSIMSVAVIGYYYFAARLEEEKFLQSEYKDLYKKYVQSVGMFLPKIKGKRL